VLADDAWLSGFTDGEACFFFRTREPTPGFKIALRADDLPILEAIRAEFGGSLRVNRVRHRNGPNWKPQAELTISGKRDLVRLVAYFDRFPLRAKKARDYAIWRRGVGIYCAHGRTASELPALAVALKEGRRYDSEEDTVAEPVAPPQLRLAESA